MQAKKKRLTLDMDPAFQRRLKATAALKGISMRQYCLTAIEGELDKDEVDNSDAELEVATSGRTGGELDKKGRLVQREARFTRKDGTVVKTYVLRDIDDDEPEPIDLDKERPYRDLAGRFRALRKEVFGDTVLPGNSADLIREAREFRTRQMEDW